MGLNLLDVRAEVVEVIGVGLAVDEKPDAPEEEDAVAPRLAHPVEPSILGVLHDVPAQTPFVELDRDAFRGRVELVYRPS